MIGLLTKALQRKEELRLTEDQIQKLRDMRSDYIRSAMKLIAELKIKRFELQEEFSADHPDFNHLRTLTKHAATMKLERRMALIDALERAAKTLTTDQRKKLRKLLTDAAPAVPLQQE